MNVLYPELLFAAGLIGILIALNALLVAGDFSLLKLHFGGARRGPADGKELSRAVLSLLADVTHTSWTIRFAINLVTIGLGMVLVGLFRSVGEAVAFPADWLWTVSVVLAFFLAVMIHFLAGELVPRALALNYPERALRISSWLILLVRFFTGGVVRLLGRFSRRIFHWLRVEAELEANLIDVEVQVRSLLQSGEAVSPLMAKILSNAVDLRNRVAQDVLLPRNQVQYFDLEDSNEANLELARKTGHTRFPICDGDLDRCVGVIHIKDIFCSHEDWQTLDLRSIAREMGRFSVDEPLEVVLQKLLSQKRHMALVIDEFGGTVGAITLENVLEELVGEIQDEFDREEAQIQRLPDGDFLIDGLTPVHDVAEALGEKLETTEVSTFGGFITSELGRMPRENSTVQIGRLAIQITGANEKRVTSTKVRVLPPEEEETSGVS